jgi:hypothetical protein
MTGKHAVQTLLCRGDKLVSTSKIAYFDVQPAALQVNSDPSSRADVSAPADTPIDVVPGASGCATTIHFLTGDFTNTPSHP